MSSPNMTYCMFRNTKLALEQVLEEYDSQTEDISKEEDVARLAMIELCRDYLDVADEDPLYDPTQFEEDN